MVRRTLLPYTPARCRPPNQFRRVCFFHWLKSDCPGRSDHLRLPRLGQFDGQKVEVAFTTGCGDECPLVRAKRRQEWQIPDPKEMLPTQDREVRDMIARKDKTLLVKL